MIRFAGRSNTGCREINEDRAAALVLGDGHLFAVADGLGGHPAGEVASELAIRVLIERLSATGHPGREHLKQAVFDADREIITQQRIHPEWAGMGTTISACLVNASLEADIVNVGDSRTSVIGGSVWHTRDQSYVQDLVDSGNITAAEAMYHPLNNIVLQALGETGRELKPDLYSCNLAGMTLLQSTDGLHDSVSESRIRTIVEGCGDDPEECCRVLVETALASGSRDNITVILARLTPG